MYWLTIFSSLCLLLHCDNNPQEPEKQAVIALYSDKGCWDESVQAAEKMFQWMGKTVVRVNADYINKNGLANFKVLCIPGGDMYLYARDISSTGKKNVRDFIQKGGGYIGICGGAYFAGEKVIWQGNQLPMTSLGLFSGTAKGPIDEIAPHPKYAMCKVNIVDSTHQITQSEPDVMWILYSSGPILLPNKSDNLVVLARYDSGNQPAMLACEYGAGRVFLIGTHPEIEEDSDRDSVTWGDEMDDRGSDWELIKNAVCWLIK